MIRNYLKTALRNIFKHKAMAVVNVLGLTIGLSCTILIAIYIRYEISYDRFHDNADNIYRIERIFNFSDNRFHSPHTNHLITPKVAEALPEIEKSVRIWDLNCMLKDSRENVHEQNVYFADSLFFEIFSFPLIEGNYKNVLKSPGKVVLSEAAAQKYFGTTDITGKTIEMQKWNQTVNLEVTGVMKNIPENSHLQTDIIVSYETVENMASDNILNSWLAGYLFSYVLLENKADPENLKSSLSNFVDKNLGVYKEHVDIGEKKVSDIISLHFQPLSDIYLFADVSYAIGPVGDIDKLYTAGAIALLILVIACINYVNLSTAKSLTRSKEVGLRKIFGAGRKRVMLQFIAESVLLALMAIVVSMVVLESILPFFNNYLGKTLVIGYLQNPWILVVLLAFALLVGLMAGLYPALHISSYRPAVILKQKGISGEGHRSAFVRKGLVILQFAISVALIIAVLTMNKQLQFMVNKDPGFNKEQVMILPLAEHSNPSDMESIKEELLKLPEIEQVGRASKTFGATEFSDCSFRKEDASTDDYVSVKLMWVDEDFIPVMDIKMGAGRNYSRSFHTDQESAFVFNEKAIKDFGFTSAQEAIGQSIVYNFVNGEQKGKIVGVMKDFHFKTMETEIEPLALFYTPENTNKLFLRLNQSSSPGNSLEKIRKVYTDHMPDRTFNYTFLDDEFNMNYQDEIKMRKLFTVFTLLAIFIACMGLYGLAAFMTEQKTKEIGIRKAIGASSSRIIVMLSSQFLKWVLISNFIAWPLIYIFLRKWLQNFAYHIDMNYVYFILASLLTVFIAQLTVFYKAWSAAKTNPVKSLRYE